MNKEAAELLNTLGAMRTLVQMFPLNIMKGIRVESIDSPIDLIVACLSMVGVNDKEILSFVLSEIVGININLNDNEQLRKWAQNIGDKEEELNEVPFIQTLEYGVKTILAEILANIISCSIHPKVPQAMISSGNRYPLSLIDPQRMLYVSPFSDYGLLIYNGIEPKDPETGEGGTTPQGLSSAKDMNAFMWYVLYYRNYDEISYVTWRDNKTNTSIYLAKNDGYSNGFDFKIHSETNKILEK